MREAMAEYVRALHQSYLAQARLQAPAVRGRLPLTTVPFTVVAVGVRNLHVIATRERLGRPSGPEVELEDELEGLKWTLRFFDPVVLPALGLIDESAGPAGDLVRRTLGVTTYLYHLVVQPGSQLTAHHAGHAGSGLANSQVASARDFEEMRTHARGREHLIDEMEGASVAGLRHAQLLLAREIAPWDETVRGLHERQTAEEVRKAVLKAVRGSRHL